MIIMNKTYTPELAPEVLHRLRDYAEPFQDLFRYPSQFAWSGVYLRGLLEDGERKSIEPMASRVPGRRNCSTSRTPNKLCNNSSTRAPGTTSKLRTATAVSWPGPWPAPRGSSSSTIPASPSRASTPSVCNTNTAANWARRPTARWPSRSTDVSPAGHFPAALRLFLPKSWTDSPERMERAGVPAEYRHEQTKGQIALELLDQVRGEGLLPGDVVITDAGYGVSQEFRQGLERRGLFYIAGVSPEMVVFTEEPRSDWPEGRPTGTRPRPAPAWPGAIRDP